MADQQPSHPVAPASGFTTIGNELDPTAPLWRVYRDEVRTHDQNVTFDEWNKTLDILLIFAGLFSAVVTSFLIASYPLLNPDEPNDAVVNAIHALAMAINSSITLPTAKPPEPVTASALWINGLWFTSLFLALAVAFFAILAKQWLVEYNHRMADPPTAVAQLPAVSDNTISSQSTHNSVPPDASNCQLLPASDDEALPPSAPDIDTTSPTASLAWARRRQFFFAAFSDWYIPVLITQTLPFLLHIALFLFLVGLSVFVWTLNGRIARGITALTVVLFCLYFTATVFPVLRAECPTATPLIRRAREAPFWIAIQVVRVWSIILPIALKVFGPSRVTSWDADPTLKQLGRRQKLIRHSGWLETTGTTDDEVKLDTLRWLILVSGSETAITAAFQALGALPANSPFLPALRTITAGMDTAVERLGNSPVPPTAVEIVRAVRSEFILGRGSWDLPQLGLDLSSSLTKTLGESQHPDAQLLWAAMHLDGTHYPRGPWSEQQRSFSSLYNITDALLRRGGSSDSSLSTVRLLLDLPGISLPAFACLSVLLVQSPHLDHSDKALIFRIFHRLWDRSCDVHDEYHTCDGLCAVVFMVCRLDRDDPASLRIVPIIISHLLPRLMPTSTNWDKCLAPLTRNRNIRFINLIVSSDWQQSPCPPGDSDAEILSTLLFQLPCLIWDWCPETLEWFLSRARGSLTNKLGNTVTSGPDERPSILQHLCQIVRRVKPNRDEVLSDAREACLCRLILSLIRLCQDLGPYKYNDAKMRDGLFSFGLVPEIGACLGRLGPTPTGIHRQTGGQFFGFIDTALRSLDGHVENKEEYLLHLAQHCVVLDPEWTRRQEVGAHLDAPRMEELLMHQRPCTKCTEGREVEWADEVLAVIRAQLPTVKQGLHPDPSVLTASDSDSSSVAAYYTDSPSMTAIYLDSASPLAATAIPNAVTASPIASALIPIIQAAAGSDAVSSSVVSELGNATLSVPLADAPPAASEATPADALPAVTSPPLIIATSPSPTADSRATTALTRAHVTPTSPGEVDDLDSGVISQHVPAPRGDETSDSPSTAARPLVMDALETPEVETLSPVVDIPSPAVASTLPVSVALDSETTSSVGQYHYEPVIQAPRSRIASAVSSRVDDEQSVRAVGLATSAAATGLASDSALNVPAVGAAGDSPSQSVLESTPDAAETIRPSPYLPLARTVNVPTTSTSSSDPESPEDDVDGGATGSSVG